MRGGTTRHEHEHETTIIDSETMRPIGHINLETLERRHHHDEKLTPEELEERKREIHDISPEGTPAHPEFTSRGVMMLILGSFLMMIAISIPVYAFWGFAAGTVVLLFLLSIAFFGNPVIWAMLLRASERHEVEEMHHHKA